MLLVKNMFHCVHIQCNIHSLQYTFILNIIMFKPTLFCHRFCNHFIFAIPYCLKSFGHHHHPNYHHYYHLNYNIENIIHFSIESIQSKRMYSFNDTWFMHLQYQIFYPDKNLSVYYFHVDPIAINYYWLSKFHISVMLSVSRIFLAIVNSILRS